MAARILEIVAARGKMHNPETDSGGVLLGTVTAVGERYGDPPALGDADRHARLADADPAAARGGRPASIPAPRRSRSRAPPTSASARPGAPVPDDLPLGDGARGLRRLRRRSQTRDARAGERRPSACSGAGHAGKLALAAARDAMDGGTLVAVDVDAEAVERVDAARALRRRRRPPTCATRSPRSRRCAAAGAPPADLTVVVVNATGCEPTAILLTADGGTVLFFSMATSFSAAALAADGHRLRASRMLVGSGYSPDVGAYALDLVRRSAALREALGCRGR